MLALLAFALLPSVAAAEPPPLDRAVLVLVRTLAYDRALPDRVQGPLVLGLLAGDEADEAVTRMEDALASLAGVTVASHPIAPPVRVTAAALASASDRAGLDALLLAPGVPAADLAVATAFAEAHDVPLLSPDLELGTGPCLAIRAEGSTLRLVVARDHSRAQGVRWSGELLALAELTR